MTDIYFVSAPQTMAIQPKPGGSRRPSYLLLKKKQNGVKCALSNPNLAGGGHLTCSSRSSKQNGAENSNLSLLNTAQAGARGCEWCCTFQCHSWTDSIKPSLQHFHFVVLSNLQGISLVFFKVILTSLISYFIIIPYNLQLQKKQISLNQHQVCIYRYYVYFVLNI